MPHPSGLRRFCLCATGVPKAIASTACARGSCLRGSGFGFAFLFSPPSRYRVIQDTTKRPPRVNRQIRISPVRVIGADGSQLGIMEVDAALSAAVEQGFDLVEVAPLARPPVVRIMDYGKYKFEMAKQARIAKKKQHVILDRKSVV